MVCGDADDHHGVDSGISKSFLEVRADECAVHALCKGWVRPAAAVPRSLTANPGRSGRNRPSGEADRCCTWNRGRRVRRQPAISLAMFASADRLFLCPQLGSLKACCDVDNDECCVCRQRAHVSSSQYLKTIFQFGAVSARGCGRPAYALSAKPTSTRPAADTFHAGSGSASSHADVVIPNTGTNKAAGVTVAAG